MTVVSNQVGTPKKTAVIIVALCLLGILIGTIAQAFKASEFDWIYRYGSIINHVLLLISGSWSLVHLLLFVADRRKDWKKCLPWAILGTIPVIYITVMLFTI